MPRISRSQADHSVTGCLGSVHPIGHPIIQSEKLGLKRRMPGKDVGPAFKVRWRGWEYGKLKGFVGLAPQAAINIQIWVQSFVAMTSDICAPFCVGSVRNIRRLLPSSISRRRPDIDFVGVGHNEEPAPNLASTGFDRAEQARFDCKAQVSKVFEDSIGSQGHVAFDVFEEAPFRPDFGDDPADMRPEVAGVVFALAVSGKREGLAGISGSEEMNLAAPRAAVEGGNIIPERRRIQGLVFHPRHEGGCSEGFPLDVTNSAISGFCDMETELQSANAGAEGNPK